MNGKEMDQISDFMKKIRGKMNEKVKNSSEKYDFSFEKDIPKKDSTNLYGHI